MKAATRRRARSKTTSATASPARASTLHRAGLLLATASVAALTAGGVRATESGLFAGPIGGSDIRSAYLPPNPGLYLGTVGLGASYNGLDDRHGVRTGVSPAYYTAGLDAIFGVYVYPWKPFGGTIATGVSQGFDFVDEEIAPRKQSDNGFLDTYADLLVWSRRFAPSSASAPVSRSGNPALPYGLTVSGAYSMVFKDGRYKVTDLATEGHNYYVFIPNAAVTYLSSPKYSLGDGTEISARAFYDIPTKNTANGYQSGQVFDIDWALSERFGAFQAGLTGNWAHQTTRDIKQGVVVGADGNILERATLGPVLQYDIPKLRASVKAKLLFDYLDRNTFGDRVTGTVSMVFRAF